MKTYIVENDKNQVVEYFRTLRDAQRFVVRRFDQPLTILALRGQYFGEGFHTHRYFYNPSKLKFKRETQS